MIVLLPHQRDKFLAVIASISQNDNGCREWTRCINRYGYGTAGIWNGVKTLQVLAHRLSWFLHNGDIPPGLCVLHACDNRPCIEIGHLWLGTRTDNLRDAARKGRMRRGERNPNAVLSSHAVAAIRARRAMGERGVDLAAEFQVSQQEICNVIKRRIWRHLP